MPAKPKPLQNCINATTSKKWLATASTTLVVRGVTDNLAGYTHHIHATLLHTVTWVLGVCYVRRCLPLHIEYFLMIYISYYRLSHSSLCFRVCSRTITQAHASTQTYFFRSILFKSAAEQRAWTLRFCTWFVIQFVEPYLVFLVQLHRPYQVGGPQTDWLSIPRPHFRTHSPQWCLTCWSVTDATIISSMRMLMRCATSARL